MQQVRELTLKSGGSIVCISTDLPQIDEFELFIQSHDTGIIEHYPSIMGHTYVFSDKIGFNTCLKKAQELKLLSK